MTWKIELTPTAESMLRGTQDRRIQETIKERIDGLAKDPDKQGKPLTGDLARYRSLRAVGQRYRIIYRVDKDKVLVLVVAIGIRREGNKRDIYALAKKLIRLGLVHP